MLNIMITVREQSTEEIYRSKHFRVLFSTIRPWFSYLIAHNFYGLKQRDRSG